MIPNNLCTHLHSDHNYYAICTNLLDPLIDDSIMPGGQFLDLWGEEGGHEILSSMTALCQVSCLKKKLLGLFVFP